MSFLSSSLRVLRKVAVNSFIEAKLFPRLLRPWALRAIGISCGSSVIYSDMFVDGRVVTNLRIGTGVIVNNQVYVDVSGEVTIKDNAGVGARSSILTATHEMGPSERRVGLMITRPVVIGVGAWIGQGVTILPGVTVGDGAVIGAGSLVTADCEPDAVYVGRPARLVRRLDLHAGDGARDERDAPR